jgi:hypothetical protein
MSDQGEAPKGWAGKNMRAAVDSARKTATEVPVDFEGSVSGIKKPHAGNCSPEILSKMAQALVHAAEQEDFQEFYEIVSEYLIARDRDLAHWPHEGEPKLNYADIDYLAQAYGGKNALVSDAKRLLPPKYEYVITPLMLKLSHGELWPEQIERGKKVEESLAAQRALQRTFIIPAAEAVSGVTLFKIADEWCKTAKQFYSDLANSLADAGCPNLAAIVQTLNDLLIPGSAPEVIISILPVSRVGGVASVALNRIGRASPRLLATARRMRCILNRDLAPPIKRIVERVVKRKEEHELVLLVRIEESMIEILPSHVNLRGSKQPLVGEYVSRLEKRALSTIKRALKVPEDLGIAFERRIVDGKEYIVQSRKGISMAKVTGGRPVSAQRIAEKAGYASLKDQNWAHLFPHCVGGENEVFNIVRTNARINQSYGKMIDYLNRQDLSGATLDVEVLFSTIDDALNRHAAQLIWKVNWPDKRPFMLHIVSPAYRPDMTYMEVLNAVMKQARRIERGAIGTAQEGYRNLINLIMEP